MNKLENFKVGLLNGIKEAKNQAVKSISQACDTDLTTGHGEDCFLIRYAQFVGLHHLDATGKPRRLLQFYNVFVVVTQIAISLRMLSLIRFLDGNPRNFRNITGAGGNLSTGIVNPSSVLFIAKTLFCSSGTLASILLFFKQKRFPLIRQTLEDDEERQDVPGSTKPRSRYAYIMSSIIFISSTLVAVTCILSRREIMRTPKIPSIVSKEFPYVLVDGYIMFMSQSAIMLVAAIFGKFCNIMRGKTERLITEMLTGSENDDNSLTYMDTKTALKMVSGLQNRYQVLQDANQMLEKCFSFSLFYSYVCAIPLVCFMLYVILHDQINPTTQHLEVKVFIFWISIVVALLLCFSIPAFRVHEEAKRLVTACFKMYHVQFSQQRDPILLQAVQFFSFQMDSARLAFTAANFFIMDRSIILTLVSAILMVFIILIQLAQNTAHCGNGPVNS